MPGTSTADISFATVAVSPAWKFCNLYLPATRMSGIANTASTALLYHAVRAD